MDKYDTGQRLLGELHKESWQGHCYFFYVNELLDNLKGKPVKIFADGTEVEKMKGGGAEQILLQN